MRKYSQKELLTEGFFDFIKKPFKAMQVIDPKASENLLRPFKQTRDVYRSFVPAKPESTKDTKSSLEYISSSQSNGQKFVQKNPKIIQKIASNEKDIYNRELDPSNITTVNIKLPDGKAVQHLIIVSKNLQNPNKPAQRYMYDKFGKFVKKL
jgi:hypothetical protein